MSDFTTIYECFMLIMMFVIMLNEVYKLYKSLIKSNPPNYQPVMPALHSTHYNRPIPSSVNVPSSYPHVQ